MGTVYEMTVQDAATVNAPDSALRQGRTLASSAHMLSPSLGAEPGIHLGVYLRTVDEIPWLRGFACEDLRVFAPENRWILAH